MSTNNTTFNISASREAEQLKSEVEVGKSVVECAKNRYADELGGKNAVSEMRQQATLQPKTYKLPKSVKKARRNRLEEFLTKIKVLFGLSE